MGYRVICELNLLIITFYRIRKQGIQSTEILKNVPSDEKVSVDAHSLLLNSLFFTENKSLEVDLQKNFKRSTAQSVESEYENVSF